MTAPGLVNIGYGADALTNPASGLVTWASADGKSFKLRKDDGTESIFNAPSNDVYGATTAKTLQTDANGGMRLDRLNVGNVTGAIQGQIKTNIVSQWAGGTEYWTNLTGSTGGLTSITLERDYTLVKWLANVYVNGTNNGSNYWNLQLYRLDTSAVVSEVNTSALSGSTWYQLAPAPNYSLTTSMLAIWLNAIKVNSPGGLYLNGLSFLLI